MNRPRLHLLALFFLASGLPACTKDDPATGAGKLDGSQKDTAKDSSDGGGPDAGSESQGDTGSDATGEPTEAGGETGTEVAAEPEPEPMPEPMPEPEPDAAPDLAPDLPPDLAPDLPADMPPDLPPDLAPDLPPDMPPCTLTADAGPSRTVPRIFPVTLGVTSVAGAKYAWTCDRADCGLSSTIVAQPVARPLTTTTYTVLVTKGTCMAMASATLTVPLRLVDTTPRDGTLAPASGKIVAHFDEALDPATVSDATVELIQTATGAAVAATITVSGRAIIVKPTGAYNSIQKDYTLTLHSAIASTADTGARTLANDVEIALQVGTSDPDAPIVESYLPSFGAVAVKLNAVVQVHYKEPLDPSSVNTTNVTLAEMVSSLPVAGEVSYEPVNNTIIFRPSAPLAGGTAYKVTLADVADVSGNFYAMDTSWAFTTSPTSTDVTSPSVSGSSPVNGAIDIPVTGFIDVVMSEPIDPASLTGIYVRKGPAGPPLPTLPVWDGGVGAVRVSFLSPLEGESTYSLVVSGVTDWPGNLAGDTAIGFTTGKAPFRDDFEAGTAQWTLEGDWAGAALSAHSGTMALSDSPAGSYPGSLSAGMVATSIAFDVGGLTTARLTYWVRGRSELGSDFLHLEWTVDDGATWKELFGDPPPLSGLQVPGYRAHTIVLPGMPTAMMKVRFRLTSNALKSLDGFTIDDVAVTSP